MSRVIADKVKGEYYPMVGIREKGNFIKGKVLNFDKTAGGNPVVTLQLIDMDGTSSKSVSKGVYEEVDVNIGDKVQLIASNFQLKDKLPQVEIGETVTVTFLGKVKMGNGRSLNQYRVEVD